MEVLVLILIAGVVAFTAWAVGGKRQAGTSFWSSGRESAWLMALSRLATRTKGTAYLQTPGYPWQVRFRARDSEIAVLLLPHPQGYVLAVWTTLPPGDPGAPVAAIASNWEPAALTTASPFDLPFSFGSVTSPGGTLYHLCGPDDRRALDRMNQDVLGRLEQAQRTTPGATTALFLRDADACVAIGLPRGTAPLNDSQMTLALNVAMQIADLLTRAQPGGIDFVEPYSMRETEPESIKCQVCGDEVGPIDLVRCSSCKTPHHRDCWEYNGQCATYGCQSKHAETGANWRRA